MKKKIVIFDDDEILLEHIELMFKQKGFDPICIATFDKFEHFLKNDTCDLFIIDYMVPGTDGNETTRLIKSQYPNTPIIMISSKAQEYDIQLAYYLGVAKYLVKPINMDQLVKETSMLINP